VAAAPLKKFVVPFVRRAANLFRHRGGDKVDSGNSEPCGYNADKMVGDEARALQIPVCVAFRQASSGRSNITLYVHHGKSLMETRIQVIGKFSITGRAYKWITYDILSGEVHSLPTGTLAQSETTGAVWHITGGAMFGRVEDLERLWRFPPLFVTPVDHHEAICEGEILKIISPPDVEP
jgi:hypothetical protein